jgi:hypothetical protein
MTSGLATSGEGCSISGDHFTVADVARPLFPPARDRSTHLRERVIVCALTARVLSHGFLSLSSFLATKNQASHRNCSSHPEQQISYL